MPKAHHVGHALAGGQGLAHLDVDRGQETRERAADRAPLDVLAGQTQERLVHGLTGQERRASRRDPVPLLVGRHLDPNRGHQPLLDPVHLPLPRRLAGQRIASALVVGLDELDVLLGELHPPLPALFLQLELGELGVEILDALRGDLLLEQEVRVVEPGENRPVLDRGAHHDPRRDLDHHRGDLRGDVGLIAGERRPEPLPLAADRDRHRRHHLDAAQGRRLGGAVRLGLGHSQDHEDPDGADQKRQAHHSPCEEGENGAAFLGHGGKAWRREGAERIRYVGTGAEANEGPSWVLGLGSCLFSLTPNP